MSVTGAREAMREVLRSEMRRNDRCVLLGENLHAGGSSNSLVVGDLVHEFGPARVLETPVSENAIVGGSLGLALEQYTAIAEIYSSDFVYIAGNELINDIPKWRFQHGADLPLAVVVRAPNGRGPGGGGPEHSQCMERYLYGVPGLVVATPGTAADAAGLLRSAIRSQRPVVFLEHRRLYEQAGWVPDDPEFMVPLGRGEQLRDGDDVTIVAWGGMRQPALEAATLLAQRSIAAGVVDMRCVAPLDWDLLLDVGRTSRRFLIAEEGQRTGGVAAEVAAELAERTAYRVPVARVAMPDVPHPYDVELERALIPDAGTIAEAAERLCQATGRAAAVTTGKSQ